MNAKNMAADAGIAMKSSVCIKPKATPDAMKATNINKNDTTAGMLGATEVIRLHLSENRGFQVEYILADDLIDQSTLRHSAACAATFYNKADGSALRRTQTGL